MAPTLQTACESIPSLRNSGDPAGQINLASERLFAFGKWRGLVKPLHLKVYEKGTITLPQDYETLLGARVRGVPQRLHDPWFQFVPTGASLNYSGASMSGGSGLGLSESELVSLDLGDGHITYRELAGATNLRLVSGNADAAKTFSITVRPTEDEGVLAGDVTVSGALGDFGTTLGVGGPASVVSFSKGRTTALVALEANIVGTWVEVARFLPGDTEICLRKYSLPQAAEGDVALAYCKRRFRPVSQMEDPLPIDSLYVLRLAIEAVGYEATGDLKSASDYWALARKALDDSLSEHRAAASRTMPVICRAAAGAGLRAIR